MDFVQGPCVRSGKYLTKLLRNIDWFGSIPMIVQSAPVIHVGYAFGDWRRWFDLICRKINALHSLICFLHRSSLEILSSAMPLIKYPLSLHNSCSFWWTAWYIPPPVVPEFQLNTYYNSNVMDSAIHNITYPGGMTMTSLGLQYVRTTMLTTEKWVDEIILDFMDKCVVHIPACVISCISLENHFAIISDQYILYPQNWNRTLTCTKVAQGPLEMVYLVSLLWLQVGSQLF